MAKYSFLYGDELARFHLTYLRRRYRLDGGDEQEKTTTDIFGILTSWASYFSKDRYPIEQRVASIRGPEHHGLTWASQEALEALYSHSLPWHVLTPLQGTSSQIEVLANRNWRRIWRILKSHREVLAEKYPWGKGFLLVFFCVVCVATYTLLNWFVSGVERIQWGDRIVLSVATGILSVLSAYLFKKIGRRKAIEAHLNKLDPKTPVFTSVVREIASQILAEEGPTAIVVDDFAKLHAISQAVILGCLGIGPLDHAIVWIVFEPRTTDLLRKELELPVITRRRKGVSIEYYSLLALSSDERILIAQSNDLSHEQANNNYELFMNLRCIVPGERDKAVYHWTEFLASPHNTGQTIKPSSLARILMVNNAYPGFEPPYGKLISLFSKKATALFPRLMAVSGQPPLSQDEVKAHLANIRRNLSSLLVSDVGGHIRLQPYCSELGMVNDDEVFYRGEMELFWFVYWARRNTGDAHFVQKLSHHAARVIVTSRVWSHDPKLGYETVNLLLKAAKMCLGYTFFKHCSNLVPSLVNAISAGLRTKKLSQEDRLVVDSCFFLFNAWLATGNQKYLSSIAQISDQLQSKDAIDDRTATVKNIEESFVLNGLSRDTAKSAIAVFSGFANKDEGLKIILRSYAELERLELLYAYRQIVSLKDLQQMGIEVYERTAPEVLSALGPLLLELANRPEFQGIAFYICLAQFQLHAARIGLKEQLENALLTALLIDRRKMQSWRPTNKNMSEVSILERKSLLDQGMRLWLAACSSHAIVEFLGTSAGGVSKVQSRVASSSQEYEFVPDLSITFPAWYSDILDFAFELWGILTPKLADNQSGCVPTQVLTEVNNIYEESAIVWMRFGLGVMERKTLLRRANYLLKYSLLDANTLEGYQDVVQGLSNLLARDDRLNYLANLLLCDAADKSIPLKSRHLVRCAAVALSRLTDAGVLAMATIWLKGAVGTAAMGPDSQTAVRKVLEILRGPAVLLYDKSLAPEGVAHAVFILLEHARRLENTNFMSEIKAVAQTVAQRLTEEGRKDKADSILSKIEFFEDLDQIKSLNRADSEFINSLSLKWIHSRWAFAAIMDAIWVNCPSHRPTVQENFLLYLKDYIPHCWLHQEFRLVLNVGKVILGSRDSGSLQNFTQLVRKKVLQFAPEVCTARVIVELYALMEKIDIEGKHRYKNKVTTWSIIDWQTSSMLRVEELTKAGNYFVVFKIFVDLLDRFGTHEKTIDEAYCDKLYENIQAGELEAIRPLLLGKKPPITVKEIGHRKSRRYFTNDFILYGNGLWELAQIDTSPEVEEAMFRLNIEVKSGMEEIMDVVATSDEIPSPLHDLLTEYRRARIIT